MVALKGLQVSKTAHDQPLRVLLALVDHPDNMLRENLPCLEDHRRVVSLELFIDVECAFNSCRATTNSTGSATARTGC
jgi:hypothetical protein